MADNESVATIVIPTFNRAKLLSTAIDSALAQTVNCEIIIVNHGSTDNTDEIVETYGNSVRYIKRDNDFGPHFCWLEGVLSATTQFVHLQYDDDWIEPNFIESCLSLMEPDVGFAFSSVHICDDKTSKIIETQFNDWLPKTGIYKNSRLEKRILNSLISPGCALYRKQLLLDSLYQGRLPLATAEYRGVGPDCWITLQSMLRYKKLAYVKESLATFRAHEGSITIDAKKDKEKKLQINKAYGEIKRYYREMKILSFARKMTGWK